MKSNRHVMVDLETLGNKPGCVIVSIGAVQFSKEDGIIKEFYTRVDAQSCVKTGLKLDPETVLWWFTQNEEARKEVAKGGDYITLALSRFEQFLEGDEDVKIWGNGASFDNTILVAAYNAVGLPVPWKFYNDRCYRTAKNLFPQIKMARSGTHHNALDDARSQALHLIQMPIELQ